MENCDYNYLRYVGWEETVNPSHVEMNSSGGKYGWSEYHKLFSPENIKSMSTKITELLQGVDQQGRDIVVSDANICSVMSAIYHNSPEHNIGDPGTRLTVPGNPGNDIGSLVLRTINAIVMVIKDETETIKNNKKLTIWTSVYGDFNDHGLRGHPPIKIRKKKPQQMMFNMNY